MPLYYIHMGIDQNRLSLYLDSSPRCRLLLTRHVLLFTIKFRRLEEYQETYKICTYVSVQKKIYEKNWKSIAELIREPPCSHGIQ